MYVKYMNYNLVYLEQLGVQVQGQRTSSGQVQGPKTGSGSGTEIQIHSSKFVVPNSFLLILGLRFLFYLLNYLGSRTEISAE